MKIILFIVLLISGSTFAQTNIIAAKSHASSKIIDKNDADNFGNPPEILCRRIVEKVIYLKDGCIGEHSQYLLFDENQKRVEMVDTICDHPFLQPGQIDIERLKAMYPSSTQFEGFENLDRSENKSKKSNKELRAERKESKESKASFALIFFLIGGGLFLIYLFVPKMSAINS